MRSGCAAAAEQRQGAREKHGSSAGRRSPEVARQGQRPQDRAGIQGSGAHAHAKKAGNEAHKGQERQCSSGRQAGCGSGSAANAVQQKGRQGMRAVAAQDSKQKDRQAGQCDSASPPSLGDSNVFQAHC